MNMDVQYKNTTQTKNEGKYDYKYKKIYINMKTKMWMNIKKLNISDFLN